MPMEQSGSLSSAVLEASWIVDVPLRYMMHSQLQEKMCQASNNAQLSLRITSRQRKNSHTHDLHFCVRNCLSWVYELNGFLFHEISPVSPPHLSLYFPLGSHSIPCSALTPLQTVLYLPLFLASSWEKHILMHLLNEFRLKVYMKSQMKKYISFTN